LRDFSSKTIVSCSDTVQRPRSGFRPFGSSRRSIEDGETPGEALQRELREELGIDVADPGEACLARLVTDSYVLTVWLISEWTGTPNNASPIEHDEIAWFEKWQLTSIDLADQNYEAMIADVLA